MKNFGFCSVNLLLTQCSSHFILELHSAQVPFQACWLFVTLIILTALSNLISNALCFFSITFLSKSAEKSCPGRETMPWEDNLYLPCFGLGFMLAPPLTIGWTWTCKACYYGPAGLRVAGRGGDPGPEKPIETWKYFSMSSLYSPFFPLIKTAYLSHKIARGPVYSRLIFRDSPLAWSVILSVHGADTIAEVKLLLSPFLRWSLGFIKSIIGFQNNYNLYVIIYRPLIIN